VQRGPKKSEARKAESEIGFWGKPSLFRGLGSAVSSLSGVWKIWFWGLSHQVMSTYQLAQTCAPTALKGLKYSLTVTTCT